MSLRARLAATWRAHLSGRGAMQAAMQTTLVSVCVLLLNLATGIITARALGPSGRGELAAIVTWPQFMAFALTLGLPSAFLYNLRCHPERGSSLLAAVLLLGSVMGVAAAGLGAVVLPVWLTEYDAGVVRFAQLCMATAPLALFTVVFTSGLLAREEYRRYNAARLAPPLTVLAGLGLCAITSGITPRSAGLATLAGATPACLWMLHYLWTRYRPARESLGWASGRLLSYGFRSYGVDLLGTLATQIDRVFVMGLLSPALMGLYIVAVNVALVLNVFPTAAVSVLFPKSSGRPVAEVLALTGRAARVTLLTTGLCAAGGALVAPVLLRVLYGPGFMDAVPVLRLLLAEAVLRAVTWVLAQAFMGLNQPGVVTVVQGLGAAAFIPLLLVLVPRFGVIGAGGALLVATALRFLLMLCCFPFILSSRPPDLRPRWRDVAGMPGITP